MKSEEYTYGHNVYKETYPQRLERAKVEEDNDDFYDGYIRPSKYRELASVIEQIRNYPTPIAKCDTQFDDLLKERDRLQQQYK